ncbi:MAG TPA: phage major capsid protein [Phycisphaerae bacterium]|nr:phage major capsid protein [Phycisphaerae bacterium]
MKVTPQEFAKMKETFKAGLKVTKTRTGRQSYDDTGQDDRDPSFSLSKYLRGVTFGSWAGADVEKKAHDIAKAYSTDAAAAGGVLVPQEVDREIIPRLADKSVIRQMPGVSIVPMGKRLSRDFTGIDSGATISWGSEASTISESTSMDFAGQKMELKKAVCILKISRELVEQPGPDADTVIRDELVRALAEEESKVLMRGLGGQQPLGIYSQPRIHSTDLSGEIDQDDLLTAELQLENSNAILSGWITNPTVKDRLRKLKDGNGAYVLAIGGFGSTAELMDVPRLFGKVLRTTTGIPTTGYPDTDESFLVGGMWSDFLLGDGDLRIESSAHDLWTADQISIRLVKRLGYILKHSESFVVVKGITSS